MPSLIANILLQRLSPHQLYLELSHECKPEPDSQGGLGKYFVSSTSSSDVNDALDINDVTQEVISVKNISRLYVLANKFRDGDPFYPININKYAICLALIWKEASDNRMKMQALQALEKLYRKKEGKLQDQETGVSGLTVLGFINRHLESYRATASTSVQSSEVEAVEAKSAEVKPKPTHTFRDVQVGKDIFIRKEVVHSEVAELEVFSGTMMELFIGSHQPATSQEETADIFEHKVSILSKKLNFTSFRDKEALTRWADDGFLGAAEIDVANVFMAEDDCHGGNIGCVMIEGRAYAVRIDFDRTIAPLSLMLLDAKTWSSAQKKRYLDSDWLHIQGLKVLEGLELHEDNLARLPLLPAMEEMIEWRPEKLKMHYIPAHWWYLESHVPPLQEQINRLNVDSTYVKAKFQAILEKIILPHEVIVKIATDTIINEKNRASVLKWMLERQVKMREVALKVPGFAQFILAEGEAAKNNLKEKFDKFAHKKNQIFSHSIKYYSQFYDSNFKQLLNSILSPTKYKSPCSSSQIALALSPSTSISLAKAKMSPAKIIRHSSLAMTSSPSPFTKGITFLLSVLGTAGAASIAAGIGVFGLLNIWNPLGWLILGAAVVFASSVALSIKNKSIIWGMVGLLPVINILGALKQCFADDKKQSYIPLPSSFPGLSSVSNVVEDEKRGHSLRRNLGSHSASTTEEKKEVKFPGFHPASSRLAQEADSALAPSCKVKRAFT